MNKIQGHNIVKPFIAQYCNITLSTQYMYHSRINKHIGVDLTYVGCVRYRIVEVGVPYQQRRLVAHI